MERKRYRSLLNKIISIYCGLRILIIKFAHPKSENYQLGFKENFNTSILCPKTLRLEKVLIFD